MRYRLKIALGFIFLLSSSTAVLSQDPVDSLKNALKTAKNDTTRAILLSGLAETASEEEWGAFNEQALVLCQKNLEKMKASDPFYRNYKKLLANATHNKAYVLRMQGNIDDALKLHHEGIHIMEEIGDSIGVAQSYEFIAAIHQNRGEIREALELFNKSLKLSEQIHYTKGIGQAYLDISTIYQLQGNIPAALKHYDKSLRIMESLGNKKGMAHCLNNVGLIYFNQNDIDKALENYSKSLSLYESIGDGNGVATLYNNLATVFRKQEDIERSVEFFLKSYHKYQELLDQRGMAMALNNIGKSYLEQNKIPEAIDQHNKSLKIYTALRDKMGMAQALHHLGNSYLHQKDHVRSLQCNLKSMALSKELGYPDLIADVADNLAEVYEIKGDHKNALENMELYIKMQDSIKSVANRKAGIRSQLKYEYDRKAAADSIDHVKEIEISNIELEKQKAELVVKRDQQYVSYGGFALVVLLASVMYKRYKDTEKQRSLIEEKEKEAQAHNSTILLQKTILEEKQKEILDSISYAKRIQLAHMPTEKYVAKNLERLNSK